MSKIASKSTVKRARKIKRTEIVEQVAPALLQLTHAASVAHDDVEFIAVESETANDEIAERFDVVVSESASEDQDAFPAYVSEVAYALRARIAYESAKKSDSNVADMLMSVAKRVLQNERVAREYFNAKVTPDYVMQSKVSDTYFNNKTAMRMTDIARFLAGVSACEKYSRAIVSTAFNFYKNEVAAKLDSAIVVDCMSRDKRNCAAQAYAKFIVSTPDISGDSTISAQKSMTLNALVEFDVLRKSRNSRLNEYTFNPDSYASKRFVELLALA